MSKASKKQIGGSHYRKYGYQPTKFINDLNLSFIQGNIIKYVLRHKDKNGIEDINKAIHYAEMAIEWDAKGGCDSDYNIYSNEFTLFSKQFDDTFILDILVSVLLDKWQNVIDTCNQYIKNY